MYVRVVVDDDSRFALAIEGIASLKTTEVTAILERVFAQYSTPQEILTDKGNTFTSVWTTGTHQFEAFCDFHDVTHLLTAPYDPFSNGKAEAMIQTLKRECLTSLSLSAIGIGTRQQPLERFREYDNFHRRHSGLGYDVPSGSYGNVRLQPTLRAIPQLESMDLPHSLAPEKAPRMDLDFIHRHTVLVPV